MLVIEEIHQNKAVALRLVKRMKTMTALEFFMSLSVKEWQEYMLFFLHQSHDSRNSRVNFKMEVKYWFPLEFGNDRDGSSTEGRTFENLRSEIMPPQKVALSQAVNNLLRIHQKNAAFVESVFTRLSMFTSPDGDEGQMISYDFAILQELIDSDIPKGIKEIVFLALLDLTGIQKPASKAFLKIMLRYREVYKRSDSILTPIMYWLIEEGWYHEAFKTLKYLSQWPQGHGIDESIPKMLKPYVYGRKDQPVTLKYVVEQILPFLDEDVKENLISLLKEGYAKAEDFESISDEKFPADTADRKLINAL
jgi:hypothetical protein